MARMMAGNSKFHDQSLRDQAARLLSALLRLVFTSDGVGDGVTVAQ